MLTPNAKKSGLTGIVVLLTSLSALAVASKWDQLLDKGTPSDVRFGAILGGLDPFERNADDPMAPASTAKLLTAGAALERLGADYRFPTKLQWRQTASGIATGVTLVGSGDPTWGMQEFGYKLDEHLQTLAKALAEQGVKEADSAITLALDPRWQIVQFPSGWKDGDSAECEGAVGQAFNLSANCALFKVTGLNSGIWATQGMNVPVEFQLTAGGKTSVGAYVKHPTTDAYVYVITGTWSAGSGPEYLTLPVHDTRPWVQELFLRALKANGINVHPIKDLPPEDLQAGLAAKEQVFYSPKLAVILQPFLKNSINFIGDALIKAVGAMAEPDSQTELREAGIKYVQGFLAAAGVPDGYVIHDGSGLSRTARISPRQMSKYLQYLKGRSDFQALLKALPVAGRDGTLRNRMKGTAAEGVLKAKTGTLDGVYNLAGFIPRGNDYVTFVVYSETIPGRASVVRGAIDRVGAALTQLNYKGFDSLLPLAAPEPERQYPFVKEHSGENHD